MDPGHPSPHLRQRGKRGTTMAIFARIADILKANINDMIDKAEDPEKMVKQLIIEI